MCPSRLIGAAPRQEYGLPTAATAGAPATLPSIAETSARTAGARTPPGPAACQTIVSWSPACPGNAFSSKVSAVVEPVPGKVTLLEYAVPAARPPTPRMTTSASHAMSTHQRRWKHQRAIAAMSVSCPCGYPHDEFCTGIAHRRLG